MLTALEGEFYFKTMKKVNWGVIVFGFVAACIMVAIVYKSANEATVQAGPDPAQVARIQAEMKAQTPAGLPIVPKEMAEAGVSMRGPGAKRK